MPNVYRLVTVVSELGPNGACAKHGLKVGDVITKVNGIPTTDHRTAIWLIDEAVGTVRFSVADTTRTLLIDRKYGGDVGITCVSNTQTGYGAVVAGLNKGLAGWAAGLRVGSVILAVNGILAFEHKQAVRQIDHAKGVARIVVASTILTDETVLRQHTVMVPCDIEVATAADTGYAARALEQAPSSLPLTMKLNNLPERPTTCPFDQLESSCSAQRSGGRTVPKGPDGDLEITVITHPNGNGVGEQPHESMLACVSALNVCTFRPPTLAIRARTRSCEQPWTWRCVR